MVASGMPIGQLAHSLDVLDRSAKSQEVLNELLADFSVVRHASFDDGIAGHRQVGVRPDQVEIVHAVSVAVAVMVRLDSVAQLEAEVQTSLARAIERTQPDFHDGLCNGTGVLVSRAVDDL